MKKNTASSRYRSTSTLKNVKKYVQFIEPVASENTASKLISFSVTTDSVVATVHLVFNDTHTRIVLHWGDDETEVINLDLLRLLSTTQQLGGNEQAPNTLTFQHVYKPPFDHGRTILIAATTDKDGRKTFDSAVFDLDPRYKLDFYPIILSFPEHLDSIFEQESEVDVLLSVYREGKNIFGNHWKESVVTNPNIKSNTDEPITWKLNNSNFGFEIAFSEEPIFIRLDLEEDDKLLDDDSVVNILVNALWDTVTLPFNGSYHFVKFIEATIDGFDGSVFANQALMPLEIHPKTTPPNGSYDLMAKFKLWPDGEIYARFQFELNLIVPITRKHNRMVTTT